MMLNCDHWFARRTLLPGPNTLHICSSPSLPFICTYVRTYVCTYSARATHGEHMYRRTYVRTHTHCRCVQAHVVHSGLCVGGGGEGGRGVEFTTMGGAVLTRDVPASAQ